jgi:UDP-glucose 4-epimerase
MGHILVTGGAGFIGSHVVQYHLKKGDSVWAIDNMGTGKGENLPAHPALRLDLADLCSFEHLQEAVNGAQRIYHLCATVGLFNVLAHPREALANNFKTLDCLLQAMVQSDKKKRLLVASSSGVYSHSSPGADGALHEESELRVPSGKFLYESYTLSKIANEVQALSCAHEQGIRCTIARIFNTIGPNQSSKYGMVVPRFIDQALKNEPLTVFGTGRQTRSFCSVHDVVTALDLLLKDSRTENQIFNVGNDRECTILELAEMIIRLTHSRSTISFIPYQKAYGVEFDDVMQRRPSLEKLMRFTGFRPQWSLEEALSEIIENKLKIKQLTPELA